MMMMRNDDADDADDDEKEIKEAVKQTFKISSQLRL